jgi:hypothetical protein
VAKDCLLQGAELGAGLDAQLLHEGNACSPTGLERLGLAPGSVERQHELAADALAERIGTGERLQLAHQLGMVTERVVGIDAVLQRRQPDFVQACDLPTREGLVFQIGKGRPAREGERLAQQPGRRRGSGAARLVDERFEAVEVQLPGLYREHISRRLGAKNPRGQDAAQVRDMHLQRLAGRLRRAIAPQLVDEAVGRDDLVAMQEQDRQEPPLLGRAEANRAPFVDDLQRAKDSEVHPNCESTPP